MSQPSETALRTAGILAAIGVAIVGTGELILHWTGTLEVGGEGGAPYEFLLGISRDRLVTGHFMAVLAVPFYFLGYWQVSERLRPVGIWPRRIFFSAALYVLTMAAIWIGSRGFLALSLQLAGDTPLRATLSSEYTLMLESLIWILRVGMMGLSLAFAFYVARGQTSYPRWIAVTNPFVLLLLVFSTILIPALGAHLVPAALNVAHVPFFLLSALVPAVNRSQGVDRS